MPPINHKIKHVPVLISDFKNLFPEIKGIWVDGTFGFGGYSDYLLKAGAKKLIVLDLDPDVKKYVNSLEKKWPNKINFFNSNFIEIKKIITSLGIEDVEGVFFFQ